MTRNKLVGIVNSVPNSSLTDVIGPKWESEIADRLLAAIEAERKGEVVLWEGTAKAGGPEFMLRTSHGDNPSVCLFPIEYAKVKGKTGQLIFREGK